MASTHGQQATTMQRCAEICRRCSLAMQWPVCAPARINRLSWPASQRSNAEKYYSKRLDLPTLGMFTVKAQHLKESIMYELKVEKMNCGGCAKTVTRAVLAVDDEAKVDIDLANKKIRVESDADLRSVASAIAGAGYPVTAACEV
jgi:copper chaperone